MGFRFRKSVNLGGGFKINLSKHGIGYSWGTKGFRYTKKSTGGHRTTASIYGTGLSWAFEGGKKKKHTNYKNTPSSQPEQKIQTYDTQNIENGIASNMVSDGLEELYTLTSDIMRKYNYIQIALWAFIISGFVFPLFWLVAIGISVYRYKFKQENTIKLDYSIDEEYRSIINKRLKPFITIAQDQKVWRILQTSKVVNKKYTSGASNLVKRKKCQTSTKAAFPFETSEPVASFKMGRETLLFLPDKVFIFQGGKVGILNYEDININITSSRFVETEHVPSDATIVGKTWEYVNKSGEPDSRFKNNKQLPVCLYGEMTMTSTNGLNIVIMFSNITFITEP